MMSPGERVRLRIGLAGMTVGAVSMILSPWLVGDDSGRLFGTGLMIFIFAAVLALVSVLPPRDW